MKFHLKSQTAQIGIVLFILFIAPSIQQNEEDEYDEYDLSRTHLNRPADGRSCRYRRRYGVCRKRSECRRSTRHVCQFGSDPVVCCMDKIVATTSTTTTTTEPPRRPPPPPRRPDSNQNIDLTFPGCGVRSPKVLENRNSNSRGEQARSSGRGGGRGLFSRLGKRDTDSLLHRHRVKRFGVRPVIVGGIEAGANSWPWMTAMFKQNVPTNAASKRFLCGASLISRQYVITAAHCFNNEDLDPAKYKIVLGSHTTKDGTEYRVRGILLHPEYNQKHYYNDLALMRLEQPVELSKKVYPVCLPSDGLRDKIITGSNQVTVMGWGDTTFGGKSSQVLLEATMPIVPLKECNASYMSIASSNFPNGITNHFLCAGEKEGGKDACQKDSGGPLVAKLKDDAYVQLGVVSFGFGCGQPGFPGVYTRLSQYTKWIYDNTDLG